MQTPENVKQVVNVDPMRKRKRSCLFDDWFFQLSPSVQVKIAKSLPESQPWDNQSDPKQWWSELPSDLRMLLASCAGAYYNPCTVVSHLQFSDV